MRILDVLSLVVACSCGQRTGTVTGKHYSPGTMMVQVVGTVPVPTFTPDVWVLEIRDCSHTGCDEFQAAVPKNVYDNAMPGDAYPPAEKP